MRYVFTDEAGCLTFARKAGVSRYFLICTVVLEDLALGAEVLNLRRQLAWDGHNASADQFHATEDTPEVRAAMFALLASRRFRVDATLYEKAKANSSWRASAEGFYKHAWFFHFNKIAPRLVDTRDNRMLIQNASYGVKKKRSWFMSALNDVAQQTIPDTDYRCTFWPSSTDPCLQIADYCAWAIQRAWERGDRQALDLIGHNVVTQYDIFSTGRTTYY